jgi:hypothetical protein
MDTLVDPSRIRPVWTDRKLLQSLALDKSCQDGSGSLLFHLTAEFLYCKLKRQLGEAAVRAMAQWWKHHPESRIAGSWCVSDILETFSARDMDIWVTSRAARSSLRACFPNTGGARVTNIM